MKLFQQYQRINLAATIIIFLVGCVAFTLLLQFIVINQIDEDLRIERKEINIYVSKFHRFPGVVEVNDQYTSFQKTAAPAYNSFKLFTNKGYNKREQEQELRRVIEFSVSVNNQWYNVSVSKSLEGADDLIQTIIAITVGLIVLILAATFLINRFVLKKLWQPFYATLDSLRKFNLGNKEKISFKNTKLEEFNYLNITLEQALNKAQNDYQSLKEFTENASHELQTPLAVIQSKLDILIQNEKMSEDESNHIQSIYNAVQNLKKLNESLLLLAKIENHQFGVQSQIKLDETLLYKCKQFSELWQAMRLQVEQNIHPVTIAGNIQLVEILLNNLLSNAIKHTNADGKIIIDLSALSLTLSNSGMHRAIDSNLLFKRFSKGTVSNEGYGLGLSIIKQICDVSGYTCHYNFSHPDIHTFTVQFSNKAIS